MNIFDKLKEMKLLVIDDDEWIRDSLSLFFEHEGCDLHAVETAEEGLRELGKEDFDIIISDYRLPGIDGLEFFHAIEKSHGDCLKILITAYGTDDVVTQAYKTGVQDVIHKPFSVEAIEKSLSRLMVE